MLYAYLGGGFKIFDYHSYLGKIPILTNIFQMGWNHQLELFCAIYNDQTAGWSPQKGSEK